MSRRRQRQNTLGIWSVIIAMLLGTALYFAIAITGFEKSKGASTPKAPRPTRPQACEVYQIEYTEDQWDEATDSYPTNHAWEDCMGVGRHG